MQMIKIISQTNVSGDLQSATMLYTCINSCPSFPNQDCFDVKQRPQSNWKLYTIYKDQAISLDEKLLSLFKDAMSLHLLYYSNQINTNEITNCDVCIANIIQKYFMTHQYSLFFFLYVGTHESIVD